MAETVQLASALTSLIGATCIAASYLRRFCNAQSSAQEMYIKINKLAILLDDISPVVSRLDSPSHPSFEIEEARRLQSSILGCLRGCNRSVAEINGKLSSISEGPETTYRDRFRFVLAEKTIRAHNTTIEGHIQNLQLSLIALNNICDSANHATTRQLLHELLVVLLYSIGLQQQHQPLPANMGIRAHAGPTSPSQSTSNVSQVALSASPTLLQIADGESGGSVGRLPVVRPPRKTAREVSYTKRKALPSTPVPVMADVTSTSKGPTLKAVVVGARKTGDDSDPEVRSIAIVDTPLAIAVKQNQAAVVRALIDNGQDVNVTDAEGWNLLHHAVCEKAVEALSVLLSSTRGQSHALINARNFKRHTALMLCANRADNDQGHIKLAGLLIKHGADVDIEDKRGRTALYLLTQHPSTTSRDKFAELLVMNGATFGFSCTQIPGRARDYKAVDNLVSRFRRTNSVASTSGSSTASSPDSPTRSTTLRQRMQLIKRRLSG